MKSIRKRGPSGLAFYITTIADLPVSANQRGGKFSTADINRQCGHSTAFFIAVLYH